MGLPGSGWLNKSNNKEISDSPCGCGGCGSWKQHWINYAIKGWPTTCGISGCNSVPTLVAHVSHPHVAGDRIVPICRACNDASRQFSLKREIALVSAKPSKIYH